MGIALALERRKVERERKRTQTPERFELDLAFYVNIHLNSFNQIHFDSSGLLLAHVVCV